MAKPSLTDKQEKYAQAVVLNGGDKVSAYKEAGYSVSMTVAAICVQADKVHNMPKVALRITVLQSDASVIAKESFTISVEQRLRWLNKITLAGMETYKDQGGNERRESLTASTGAIKTMNEMLGVSDDSSENAEPLQIVFNVSNAVKEVKVVNAKP